MEIFRDIFNGDTDWNVWFVLALVVDLLLLAAFVEYLVSWLFFQMGWRFSDKRNPYRDYVKWIFKDMDARKELGENGD